MKSFNYFLICAICVGFMTQSCKTAVFNIGEPKLENSVDSFSYALGIFWGKQLKSSDIDEINYKAMIKGMEDNYSEKEGTMTIEVAQAILQQYSMEIMKKKSEKNLAEGKKFLEENKSKSGVITTASGLQYEVIEPGSGDSPMDGDIVQAHYTGTLLDGTKFDSSVDRNEPFQFMVGAGQVIPAWDEALKLMKPGAKYKIYCPTELAYGENVRPGGPIGPNMALVFEIQLLDVKKGGTAPAQK
jgi:FKBP-type peptidyl-prolyl cis-trans isomerase